MLKNLNTNPHSYIPTNSGRKNGKGRNYLVVKGKPTRRFYQMVKRENRFKKLLSLFKDY